MSGAISSAELTAMRDSIEELLPDTCTIQKLSITKNDIGEAVQSYSTRASGVKCRIDPEFGWEMLAGFMDYAKYTGKWVLTLPYSQEIITSDRVIVNGMTFEVDHTDREKSWRVSTRATLELVRP